MVRKILVIILLTILSNEMVAKRNTVFSKGKSSYSIVVSDDASDSEIYAAKELQSYIETIGAVKIPICPCGEGVNGKRIIIGYNSDFKKLSPSADCPSPDDESFYYRNFGGDIAIVGGSERGTMYGVFSFMENELGCRWITKSERLSPHRDTYSFCKLYYSEVPAFQMRNIFYYGTVDSDFRVHCRFNERLKTGPNKPEELLGGCHALLAPHTLGILLPVGKCYDAHPEYFALRNGKRERKNTQPCLTNPEVQRICIDELTKIMRERPEFDIYEVSLLDNRSHCECRKCKNEVKRLGNYTDVVLGFVNSVAAAVESEFPEKKIEFLAYQDTRTPPVSVKPRKNVAVRICGLEVCHVHGLEKCSSKEARKYYQDVLGWKKIINNLYVWEYSSNFYAFNIPYPNFYALQDDLKLYKRLGVKGVFVEGNHYTDHGEFQALHTYVLSKLLWNPDCNLDVVVDDFIEGYYGQAAPFIRQYFDLIHAHCKKKNHLTPYTHIDNPYYDDSLIEEGQLIFQKARDAVKDNPEFLRRVELEELSVDVLDCYKNPKRAILGGAYTRAMNIIERENVNLKRGELKQTMEQMKPWNSLYRKIKPVKKNN